MGRQDPDELTDPRPESSEGESSSAVFAASATQMALAVAAAADNGDETNWAAVWYYRHPAATSHSKTIIRKRADGRRRGRIDSRGTLSLPPPILRLIYSANFASPTPAPALLCLPWRCAPSGTMGAKWVPFITPLQYTQTAAEFGGDDEATAVVLWRGEIRTTGGVT